jgi:hypothetical protein
MHVTSGKLSGAQGYFVAACIAFKYAGVACDTVGENSKNSNSIDHVINYRVYFNSR